MPSIPNPIDIIGQSLGGSLADLAQSAFNQAMKALWDFSLLLLKGVFGVIDHLTVPNLDPAAGPLSAVMPATIWVGGVLLVLLSFVQLAKAAMSGGGGLLQLFKGIAQYMIVTAAALGILTTLVSASDAAARGILAAGLNADSWQGISAANAPWQNAVHGVSGAGLGLIALLGVLPAAIGLVVAALVRQASILVIAATIPILAAGLVAEATARWFWTGLRWMFALIMLTPAVAIVVSIGFKVAASASGGVGAASADAGQQAVTAFVGAAVLLISVFCPLALFKLFAFMDPGTPSGHSLRTSLSGFGSGSTAVAGGSAGGGDGTHSGAVTPQEADASNSVDSRWASAISSLSAPHRIMAVGTTAAMSSAGPVLEAAGVGAGADGAGQGSGRTARSGGRPASAAGSRTGSAPDSSPDDGGAPPPPGPDVPGPPDGGPGSPGDGPAGSPGGPRPPTPDGPPRSAGTTGAKAAGVAEVADVAVIA
jgi:hypothetical protein